MLAVVALVFYGTHQIGVCSGQPESELKSELALSCFQPLLVFFAVSSVVPPPVTWVALFYAFVGPCICPVFELIYFIIV